MLSVTAPSYTKPSNYELSTLPQPIITEPTDVVIKVHATSVNPVDVKKAAGSMKPAGLNEKFPYQIGYDLAGVVAEIGSDVRKFKIGDEVYALLPEANRGSWSEYAKCAEHSLVSKPKSLSFGEAASLPLVALTALQALKKYKGSLAGKTVFVPAGLSGTGSIALQLAKNVFHAGKVITTVSTAKVDKVPELLGANVVDQVIDYTKNDPMKKIAPQSVDFILDTTGEAMNFLSLMTPHTGVIISVSTMPSGNATQDSDFFDRPDHPQVPWIPRTYLNAGDAIRKARAMRWHVHYEYLFVDSNAEELASISEQVENGKLRPVVGSTTSLRDIEKIREACTQVYTGKGGIGKAVFEIA